MGFQSNFNNFINGMSFGMMASIPFRCGWGFGMPPAPNFGMFTNPFLSTFSYGSCMLPPPPIFSMPSTSVWDTQFLPNNNPNMAFGGMPSVFSSYDTSFSPFNMAFSGPMYPFDSNFMFQPFATKIDNSRDNSGIRTDNNRAMFNKMVDFVFEREGGYVNHPADKGGPTNMGITQTTYDVYRKGKGLGTKDVKDLTKEEATDIYYENYYVKSGADKIKDPRLAMCVFDWAVNSGTENKAMKEALESCNGNVTNFIQARREFLNNLIAKNPSQEAFRSGWNNRLDKLETFVETI